MELIVETLIYSPVKRPA